MPNSIEKINKNELKMSSQEERELGAVAIKQNTDSMIYVEKTSNKEKLEYQKAVIVVENYLLSTQFLSEIADPKSDTINYLDVKELKYLSEPEAFIEKYEKRHPDKKISSQDILRSVFNKVIDRRVKKEPPKNSVDKKDIHQIKGNLKMNYVLGLGEQLKDYVDKGLVANISEAKSKIAALFNVSYANLRRPFEKVDLYQDQNFRWNKLNEVNTLFNAMRHESAFLEMVIEGNSAEVGDLFPEVEKTGREEELRGVDARIRAKVLLDSNNKYIFPTTAEEFERCEHEAIVEIDIKSSLKAVNETMEKRKRTGHDNSKQSLLMWSHVYNDDFRLDLIDGQPDLSYGVDEARVYLKASRDIHDPFTIMKNENFSNLRYYGNVRPENFQDRYDDIKKQILNYINMGGGSIESIRKS